MKLKTLLAYQRCFNILREAEMDRRKLTTQEFMDALRAKGTFDSELEEHTKPTEVEIT